MINSGLSALRVLYVEDEESIRIALSRFLGRRVREIYVAENGEEGLRLFNEKKPDLVVTDIQMPIMDGLKMSEKIRAIDSEVPIVIITAFNDEEYLIKAVDLSVDKFLKKPIDNTMLLSTLTKVAKVVISQKKIEDKNRLINIVLDNISELVMIVKNGEVTFMNLAFLTYVGVPDVESFRVQKAFDSLLVVKDDSFYKDKKVDEWLEEVMHNKNQQFVVHMSSLSRVSAFIVRASKISDDEGILVTFADVTDLERERARFNELATTDALTGIFNRKKFNDELGKEVERSRRYRNLVSLIFFDIDHFKKVNDTYGHSVGDLVLQGISKIVSSNIRKGDVFARWGGEEFVVLIPENGNGSAMVLAEKLRVAIENHQFETVGTVTCSFGVADYVANEEVEDLIRRADKALYQAKNSGRNCVVKAEV